MNCFRPSWPYTTLTQSLNPDRNLTPVLFAVSALWGMCDAIWQIECNCEYRITDVYASPRHKPIHGATQYACLPDNSD